MNKHKCATIAALSMNHKHRNGNGFHAYDNYLACLGGIVALSLLSIFNDRGNSWLTIVSLIALIACAPIIIHFATIASRAFAAFRNPRLNITDTTARQGYEFLGSYSLRINEHYNSRPGERGDYEPYYLYSYNFHDDNRNNHEEAKTFAIALSKSIMGIRSLSGYGYWKPTSEGFEFWYRKTCITLRVFGSTDTSVTQL